MKNLSQNIGLNMKKIFGYSLIALFLSSQLVGDSINWSFPPTTLSNAALNSSSPQVATDSNGDAVAVWVENGLIRSSSKPLNMNWSSAVTLSNSGASSPQIVSDPSGNATAVWLEGTVVKAASKPFGMSWSSATTLSNSGAASPDLAVDSSGDAIAAWVLGNNVVTATKLFGASWQNSVTIASSSPMLPSIALSGTGANKRAVVVWNGLSGATNVVYASSKLLSGTWDHQIVISNSNFQAGYAFVAMDSSANATAVWYQYTVTNSLYSNVIVQTASRDVVSNAWSAPVALSAPGIKNPAILTARVAYDISGNAVAVWNTSFDDMTYNIESSFKPVRANWTPAIDLLSTNAFASQLDLSPESYGNALALYMFYNGVSLIIQSSESDITGYLENVWSVPTNISNGTQNGNPHISANVTGNVVHATALWISTNGSNTVVNSVSGSKNLLLPPSNVMVSQSSTNFGVFTEFVNNVSWTASTDPNAIGYLIFRNGTLIGQVDSMTTSFADQNRVQNASTTYGVATIGTNSSQSVIATHSFP